MAYLLPGVCQSLVLIQQSGKTVWHGCPHCNNRLLDQMQYQNRLACLDLQQGSAQLSRFMALVLNPFKKMLSFTFPILWTVCWLVRGCLYVLRMRTTLIFRKASCNHWKAFQMMNNNDWKKVCVYADDTVHRAISINTSINNLLVNRAFTWIFTKQNLHNQS